jgi:hypothetical protein
LGRAGIGATYSEEGGSGSGSGGGEIAERAGESFATDEGGGGGAGEVDAFDHGIGFEDEIEVFRKGGEDCTVVADSMPQVGGGLVRERGGPALNPEVFGREWKFFHGRGGRERRSRMQVLALKRE